MFVRRNFPFIFFHTAGPLTLYPVTKSAAAEELENNISSVVMCSSLTSSDAICFSRIAFMPFDRDFPDVFSLISDPFRTTTDIDQYVRSVELIHSVFDLKIAIFTTSLVLGNRSTPLILLNICKRTDFPIVSRLQSEGISPKDRRFPSTRLRLYFLRHHAFPW